MAAFASFEALHWMYVSEYTSVAVMMPLAFSVQNPQTVSKRKIYPKVILTIDLAVYSIIVALFVMELIWDSIETWLAHVVWNILAVTLTFILCISLRKIKKYVNATSMSSIYSNKRLIQFHQGSFVMATSFDVLQLMLIIMQNTNLA